MSEVMRVTVKDLSTGVEYTTIVNADEGNYRAAASTAANAGQWSKVDEPA